jgi:hypothetical protein
MYGEEERCIQDFSGDPEVERPLGGPWHRWEDNIMMCLWEWDVGAWTGLIWLRTGTGVAHLYMR